MREVATTGDLTRKITLRGPAPFQDEDARAADARAAELAAKVGGSKSSAPPGN